MENTMDNETLDSTIRRFESMRNAWLTNLNACNLALKNENLTGGSLAMCIARKHWNEGRASAMTIAIQEFRAIAQGY